MVFRQRLKTIASKIKYRSQLAMGKNCIVDPRCEFEGNNKISVNVELYRCSLGRGTYVATRTILEYVKTGRFCSIGRDVHCIYGKHPARDYVSTHPAFFSKEAKPLSFVSHSTYDDRFPVTEEGYSIIIGNDVWIGDRVSIMEGVHIGDGAIIAAGAVVTRDVEPYTIVGGVPAKMIRKRFSEEQTARLQDLQWWNRSDEWLRQYADDFCNVEKFLNDIGGNVK